MLFNRVKQRRGQTNATFHTAQNISHFTTHVRVQQTCMVAKRVQHHITSRKTQEMLYRTTFVQ